MPSPGASGQLPLSTCLNTLHFRQLNFRPFLQCRSLYQARWLRGGENRNTTGVAHIGTQFGCLRSQFDVACDLDCSDAVIAVVAAEAVADAVADAVAIAIAIAFAVADAIAIAIAISETLAIDGANASPIPIDDCHG